MRKPRGGQIRANRLIGPRKVLGEGDRRVPAKGRGRTAPYRGRSAASWIWSTPLDASASEGELRSGYALISVPVIASEPFSKAPEIEHDIQFWPIEAEPRRLILDRAPATRVSESVLVWVGDHWREGGVLMHESEEFNLLMQAVDQSLFARSVKLALLSLWGALETVFSPGRNELRFRVTALIATFLEPAGENRRPLQRKLKKLYDSRSAAAHGRPESLLEPLIETYAITKCIVTKILEENRVPTPLQLENQLFGIHSG